MRNTVKHPNNEQIVTIYLRKDNLENLDKLVEMSGKNRSQIVREMVETCLPKARIVKKVVYEMTFD